MFIRIITGFVTMRLSKLGYEMTIMDWSSRLGCIEIENWDEQQSKNKETEKICVN